MVWLVPRGGMEKLFVIVCVELMKDDGGGCKLGMNGLLVKILVGEPWDCVKLQGPSGNEVAVL